MAIIRGDCNTCDRKNVTIHANDKCVICQKFDNMEEKIKELELKVNEGLCTK